MAVVNGGSASEQLAGGSLADSISGFGGNDSLVGGAGNDTLNGGAGFDLARYSSETGSSGIIANLSTGTGRDTFGNTDQLVSIEGIVGTSRADLIFGSGGQDFVILGAGNDTLDGAGGSDIVDYYFETGTR